MNLINLLQPKTFLLLSALVALTGCFKKEHYDEQYSEDTTSTNASLTINNTMMKDIILGLSQAEVESIEMTAYNETDSKTVRCSSVYSDIELAESFEKMQAFEDNIDTLMISENCAGNTSSLEEYLTLRKKVLDENKGRLYMKLELASQEIVVITKQYPEKSARFLYIQDNQEQVNHFSFN
jgi:hypothetical protein